MPLPTPSIGSFRYPEHFADWETIKPLSLPQKQVKVYHQDGVDDWGAQVGSKRGDAGIIRTEYHGLSQGDSWAVIQQYATLVGTLINVVDEFGVSWRGVLVMPFEYKRDPILTPFQRYSAEVRWVLLPGSVS